MYLILPQIFPIVCLPSWKLRKIAAYKFRNTELAIHTSPEMNSVTQKRIWGQMQKAKKKKNMSYTWTVLKLILWESLWAVWSSSEAIFCVYLFFREKNGKGLKVVKQIIKYFLKKRKFLTLLIWEENVSGYQVVS